MSTLFKIKVASLHCYIPPHISYSLNNYLAHRTHPSDSHKKHESPVLPRAENGTLRSRNVKEQGLKKRSNIQVLPAIKASYKI